MYRRASGFLVMTFLFAGCLLYISGCKPQSLVSTKEEVNIGRQVAHEVESHYKVDTDPQINALVNQIGQTLVKHCDRQNIKYTFKVLDISDVNAFSLPGGWVYVNKGLIDATRGREDELAGVIAHEIGHVVARHAAAAMGRGLEADILVGTLTRGQTQQFAGLFADLSLLHYSREQEYEADKLGIKEMWLSRDEDPMRYDAQGLVDFFGGLLAMEGNPPSQTERMFRTHPVTSQRIKFAQAYLDDIRAGKSSP